MELNPNTIANITSQIIFFVIKDNFDNYDGNLTFVLLERQLIAHFEGLRVGGNIMLNDFSNTFIQKFTSDLT